MDRLKVSSQFRFIVIKKHEGLSLREIAGLLGKKYDTIQRSFLREKQSVMKNNENFSKKI